MKLLSEPTSGLPYLHAAPVHVQASERALRGLAEALTAEITPNTRPVHVRLTMVEHGAFLSTRLYGMNLLPATGEVVIGPAYRSLHRPPAVLLRDPYTATPDEPFVYAVVANHLANVQVETVLSALAHMLARSQLVEAAREHGVTDLDRQAAEVDRQAQGAVQDTLRARGWPAAAEALRARSAAAGRPLVVRYDPIAFDESGLQRRVPVLRHVYNAMPEARVMIDKLAVVVSQTLTSIGGGSQQIAAFVRQLLDIGEHRTYLAHVSRDAFVCGNGYLSVGTARDEDLRLLRPESTTLLGPERALVVEDGRELVYEPVMHVRGAHQVGSHYGISMLEPFVQLLVQRETLEHTLALEEALRNPNLSQSDLGRMAGASSWPGARCPRSPIKLGTCSGALQAWPSTSRTSSTFRGTRTWRPPPKRSRSTRRTRRSGCPAARREAVVSASADDSGAMAQLRRAIRPRA